jgi:hypothetical protein
LVRNFDVKVVGPDVVEEKESDFDPEIDIESEVLENTEEVEFDSYVPQSTNPIVFEITKVTRLGLVTVTINQPLEVVPDSLIVTYYQRSYEPQM